MSIELYAVVRPQTEFDSTPPIYPANDQEHAEAIATVKNKEFPASGPFRVVKLVEEAA
jgi:hypothetical protein